MINTKSILLAYATRYGSTQETAEIITAVLREAGLKVDIQPMEQVTALDNYDAVVLGAAIYNAKWHPAAHQFLSQYREALSQMPVAIFSLGPTTRNPAAKKRSLSQLDKDLENHPWLKPIALEMFIGKYDLSKLGFGSFQRLTPLIDQRDPSAVRAWAKALSAQLEGAEMLQFA